jgi:DNA-binding IclR family transcriptional regulator
MVRSINRGLDVMILLARTPEPMTLSEITTRLRMPRTTAFNIVRTLTARGAIELIGTQGYRIGPLAMELARARAPSKDLSARLRPYLEQLASQTGETALLSVVSGDQIVFLNKAESPQAIRYTVEVGTRRPLYCSAHGKVALAAFSEDELDRYLDRTPLTAFTDRTIVDGTRLKRELSKIRRQGFATSDGEFIPDVYSVSAPLLPRDDGMPSGMISVVGPLARVKANRLAIASLLTSCARAASEACQDLVDGPRTPSGQAAARAVAASG